MTDQELWPQGETSLTMGNVKPTETDEALKP